MNCSTELWPQSPLAQSIIQDPGAYTCATTRSLKPNNPSRSSILFFWCKRYQNINFELSTNLECSLMWKYVFDAWRVCMSWGMKMQNALLEWLIASMSFYSLIDKWLSWMHVWCMITCRTGRTSVESQITIKYVDNVCLLCYTVWNRAHLLNL